ncbi:hypothetical protein [Mucilaginibacter sp. dw_454]|uniref:hypothetical protein n=1 Tax=Mucilaginibacter sp. dw_454 TaxID=2720079 RepID=UPI001BD538B7|nr:hypothetical protein [Mucilaginibacter sp. dw_454]
MSFLPNQNFSIITKLTPAEVQVKLDEMVGAQSFQFSGYAADGIFKLQPINGNQNSFVPQVEGIVESLDGGSRIHVRIHMPKIMSIILMIAIALLTITLVLVVVDLVMSKTGHTTFFPWLIPILVYIPLISRFRTESKNTKETLINSFQGEERAF